MAHHTHDCEACVFLGSVTVDGKAPKDCYFCPSEGGTIVIRRSGEGSDYSSLPLDMLRDMSIIQSKARAGDAVFLFALIQAARMGVYAFPAAPTVPKVLRDAS